MANVYTQSLLNEIAELWRTGEGSDMTIKCEGCEFKVHRLLVSAASPILKAACHNGMRESQTGVVEHKTFDADTVERMLEFIYTRDYEVPWRPTVATGAIRTPELNSDAEEVLVTSTSAWWIAHTRMYAIGDYYQLPTLKDQALVRLQNAAVDPFELHDFANVLKEAYKLIGKHETDFHHMIQTFCRENVIVLTLEKTFMAALAEAPEMQELTASLLGQVTRELEEEGLYSRALEASQKGDLNIARSNAEMAQQRIEREREDHAKVTAALRSQVDHCQAVIKGLMDNVGRLPLRCPNIRCSSTNKAPWKLQRQAHADYGEGTGFVEIQCGRCGHKLSK